MISLDSYSGFGDGSLHEEIMIKDEPNDSDVDAEPTVIVFPQKRGPTIAEPPKMIQLEEFSSDEKKIVAQFIKYHTEALKRRGKNVLPLSQRWTECSRILEQHGYQRHPVQVKTMYENLEKLVKKNDCHLFKLVEETISSKEGDAPEPERVVPPNESNRPNTRFKSRAAARSSAPLPVLDNPFTEDIVDVNRGPITEYDKKLLELHKKRNKQKIDFEAKQSQQIKEINKIKAEIQNLHRSSGKLKCELFKLQADEFRLKNNKLLLKMKRVS